jgi:catechol 2,3-dioxygenase-like lactoylglutathione lyase family enzyme
MQYHIRIARPTDNLQSVLKFYKSGLGFDIIGQFSDHDGFDGIMLGHKGAGYHLEFTRQRGGSAGRAPSEENLLVWYIPDKEEWQSRFDKMTACGYEPVPSFNPYWDMQGVTFEDADGYRIVLQNTSWPTE